MRTSLYRHLRGRQTDCKIVLVEHILLVSFLVLVSLATHLRLRTFSVPYTGAAFPLICIIVQRFIWHKSILKAFRSPFQFIKFIFQILVTNLVINYALSMDDYYHFDIIAMLWPCYGSIALCVIFFIATLLLFIGSACNSFSNLDSEGSSFPTGPRRRRDLL